MKTKTLAISVLLLAVILAPLAIAEPGQRGQRGPRGGGFGGYSEMGGGPGGFGGHPGMGGDMGGFLLGRLADKLGLTEDQKADIKAVTEEAKVEAEESRKAIAEAMKALHEATAEGTEADIIAAGKAVGDAFIQQALLRSGVWKQIKEILTDEQIAQLKELKTQMKNRMQQRRKDGNGLRGKRGTGGKRGEGERRGRQRHNQD